MFVLCGRKKGVRAAGALTRAAIEMSATSLVLSATERAELLRDPESFAKRAETVLTSVLHKLNRLEAERTAW